MKKQIKYHLVKKVKGTDGRDTLFVVTDGMDYGIYRAADGSSIPWEGDVNNYLVLSEIERAEKASVKDIGWWLDTLYDKDIQGELQIILGNIYFLMRNKSGKKMYILNTKSGEKRSCWNLWRGYDTDSDIKLRQMQVEICKDGISVENLQRLIRYFRHIEIETGAPNTKWYLEWISKDKDVAVVKVIADDAENKHILFFTDEQGHEPGILPYISHKIATA